MFETGIKPSLLLHQNITNVISQNYFFFSQILCTFGQI